MQFSGRRKKVGPSLKAGRSSWFQAGKYGVATDVSRADAAAHRVARGVAGRQCRILIMLLTVM
jgi:hypothetical protein